MNDEKIENFKILLLGESCVGKTCILLKYVEGTFSQNICSTIGVDFMEKIIDYGDTKAHLQIWDTSGQEKYKSIGLNFLRNADGVILVFDLTQKDTFEQMKQWLNDVNEICDDVKIIILGNKSDLKDERKVEEEIANNFAEKLNYKYFETSAKEGTNIENAFKAMADLLMDPQTREIINNKRHRGNSVLTKKNNIKKGCCK